MSFENYYTDEYSRLINRITYDENDFDSLAERVSQRALTKKNDNAKYVIAGVAVAAAVTIGVRLVLSKRKLKEKM